MPALTGTRIEGRYRLDEPIGEGGMATVWRARDLRLGRDVAVKLIAEGLLSKRDFIARFEREARIAAGLSHPNLVSVHDLGFDGGRPFLVMELIDGETLAARLDNDTLPVDVVDLAKTLLDVLATVHDAGIVHRDIKPGNVLYGSDGRIWLTDFGIARILEGTGSTDITETGLVVGTRRYMAPEVCRGGPPTPAADLYSLGVLLAQCGAESTQLRRLIERLRAEDPAERPESARLALISIAGLAPAAPERTAPIHDDEPRDEPEPSSGPERAPISVLRAPAAESHPGWGGAPRRSRDPEPTPAAAFDPEPTPAEEPEPAPRAVRHDTTGDRTAGSPRRGLPASTPTLAGALAGLIAVVVVLLLLTSGGDSGNEPQQSASTEGAAAKPEKKAKEPKPEATTTATTTVPAPAPAPAPAEEAADEAAPVSDSTSTASAAELNDQGYALLQQGQAAEAVPILQQAVDAYGGDTSDLGYAYALFNLGSAQRQSGDFEAAIKTLEQRLEIPNQTSTVQAELDLARQGVSE